MSRYVLFLNSDKKIEEYLDNCNKENSTFILVSMDMDVESLFTKKMKVINGVGLIAPSGITAAMLMDNDKDRFVSMYMDYLRKPLPHMLMNMIVSEPLVGKRNVVVCVGSVEDEDFRMSKHIRETMSVLYDDMEFFTYKDWKKKGDKLDSYKDIPDMKEFKVMLAREHISLESKLSDLESCEDPYQSATGY